MKHKTFYLLLFLLISSLILAGCGQSSTAADQSGLAAAPVEAAAAAPQEPRTLTVLAGTGQDTTTISAFLPSAIRIRAGDTLTWKIDSDEIHTVTFLGGQPAPRFEQPVPGGGPPDLMLAPEVAFPSRAPEAPVEVYNGTNYVNSGIMSKLPGGPDAPPNDTFSLTFSQPGLYPFSCILHPYMRGVVAVEEATAANVPSQADLDAQAKAEMEPLLAQVAAANELGRTPRSEPGPDNSRIWYVNAASSMGDLTAQSYEFLTKELSVNVGDTVIWTSSEFHTVTFNPAPPLPEFVIPEPQEGGPPRLLLNPQILMPAKPDRTYEPAEFYNSGIIGPASPGGNTWSLAFDKPGTYKYFCAVHRAQGMEGTIIVKAS